MGTRTTPFDAAPDSHILHICVGARAVYPHVSVLLHQGMIACSDAK